MNCKLRIIKLLNNRFKMTQLYKKNINKKKKANRKTSLPIDKAIY